MLAAGAIAATLLAAMPAGPASAAAPAGPGGRILYLAVDRSHGTGELRSTLPDGTGDAGYGRELPWYASPDYSPDGTEITYVEGFDVRAFSAVNGSDDRLLGGAPCGPGIPRWSPDGQWVAFESCGDIYAVRADDTAPSMRNVTASDLNDLWPAWSPTGARIASATLPGVHVYRADKPAAPRQVSDLAKARGLDWSPNGRTFAVEAAGDLWLVDAITGWERRLTNTPDVFESTPIWSPDGRWIAYASGPAAPPTPPHPEDPAPPPLESTESLNPQIWVMTAAGTQRHSTGVAGTPTSWRAGQ
ncbi:hypothetical protein MB27_20510 [Actinoplanes utahensis]|uniref:Uncharacterized protein n=2 Tax=Actinoplanes utahensis TaxID=1869 RepID=A0A0A6ULA1_ACTUT|nr:hypothetical protein MB27_20510 [Actinoplanes utahensis]